MRILAKTMFFILYFDYLGRKPIERPEVLLRMSSGGVKHKIVFVSCVFVIYVDSKI